MRVGFLGLGSMGARLARKIAPAGHELTVFNRTAAKMDEFVAEGAEAAASPADLASRCDVLGLCVGYPADVRDVFERPDGILAGLSEGKVVLDFSTIDPATSRAMAARCEAVGATYLDTPVSGTPSGMLTIMVGGVPAAMERAMPVLTACGNPQHVGPSGAGSTTKLINQMLLAINMCGALEALVLGARAGLDSVQLFEIVRTSSGNSSSLNVVTPAVLDRIFDPKFTLDLLFKDADLAASIGRELQMPLLMISQALQLLQTARSQGLGGQDSHVAILPIEHTAGVEVRRRA